MRGFLGLLDADVVENTPWTLPKGSRDLRSLRMLHNFRLRTPKRTPKGVNWAWVTCGSPVTTTKKKKRGKKPGMRRTYFRSRDFVTSGQKTPLGRIWRNFQLRMRRTYFRTGSLPVTWLMSLPVTWLTSLPVAPPQMWLCPYPYTTVVVVIATTYAISAYHHWCCEFESRSGRGVQHYVIKFVSDLRQVGGFLRVLRFLPPIKLTAAI